MQSVSAKPVGDDAGVPTSGFWINLGGDRSLIRKHHAAYTFMLVQPMLQNETKDNVTEFFKFGLWPLGFTDKCLMDHRGTG